MRQWLRTLFKRVTPAQVFVMGFSGFILLGSILLTLPIATYAGRFRWLDALFTSTSAVCVTGLILQDTGTTFTPFGQIVIITLCQIGALGVMTMSTLMALILGKRIGLKERILIQESWGQSDLEGVVRLIKKVVLFALAMEVMGGIVLSLRFLKDFPFGQAVYYGFFHAVFSFCNAGFDVFGPVYGPFTNLTHYLTDPWVMLTVAALAIIGGLGFPVLFELAQQKEKKRLSVHTRLVLLITGLLLALGTIFFLLLEFNNPATLQKLDWPGKILAAFFQSVTPRSVGFRALDLGEMRDASLFLMIVLMFIGASPSSTGGGIKTVTFGVLLVTVRATVKGREDVELYERRLPKEVVYKALSVTTIALCAIFLVSMLLSITEKFSFFQILYEVTSAFGNVGLTTGITPYLSDFARVMLIMMMFGGRVGLLTIAFALTQRMQAGNVRYMEENVIIG
ncbi:MAG: TrkH family potassium uptake protein [Bacillota bacterium]